MSDRPKAERRGASGKGKAVSPPKLGILQHFHIRLTGLYAGAVFVVLIIIGLISYKLAVDTELLRLQGKLLTAVNSLASSIDPAEIGAISLEETRETPLHKALRKRFKYVASQDQDIESIYLLRPTEEDTTFRFFTDFSVQLGEGKPGQLYDASDVPVMLRGKAEPSVEDKPYRDEFGLTLSGYAPILSGDGKCVGLVGVDVRMSRLQEMRRSVLFAISAVFGLAIISLLIISVMGARNVKGPLGKITGAMSAVAQGNFATRLNMKRRDEFGLMSQYFDKMAADLQEREFIRETFGLYMGKDIAETLLQHADLVRLGGEERVVTVLFSDIQGYSRISENLPPAQVVDMLNRYLGVMTDIIDSHRGCVLEFLGDAILAIFGAPYYYPDHPAVAVRCAVEMRDRLVELNDEWTRGGLARYWTEKGIESLRARIGIHTGKVIAGNLGSHTRMKYTVIGETVNVAHRLELLNKELGTDIVISAEVRGQLPDDLGSRFGDRGERSMKGHEQMVRVYSI